MAKMIAVFLASISLFSCLGAMPRNPSGNIIDFISEKFTFKSEMVNEEITSWILRPKIYDSTRAMPVVYFLHGRDDSIEMFQRIGGQLALADYISEGRSPYAIVALQGKNIKRNFYWVDEAGRKNAAGKVVETGLPWASMLMKEALPQIEEKYNIGKHQSQRMISGISMGAAGALQLAMNFSNTFKCVAGHSLVVRDAESAVANFPIAFGSISDYQERNPLSLLQKYVSLNKRPFEQIWVDIGGADNTVFLEWAKSTADEIRKLGFNESRGDKIDIGVDFPAGGHDDGYWHHRINEYVHWYGNCFSSLPK